MKQLFVALLMAVAVTATAQEQQNLEWKTDLVSAVDKAIAEKKPVMLFFTGSDWCGWCKRLQAEVFQMPQFAEWAKKNVVLLELDFPRRTPLPQAQQEQNMSMQRMFEVRGYPTVWFVTPSKNGTEINFEKLGSTGYVQGGPDAWLAEADRIMKGKP
jgi:protein disulfide-isomerase